MKFELSWTAVYLHIPLDIIILNRAAKEFKLKSPFCCKWSKINNYDEYLDYQKKLRDLISIDPIRWEFQSWIDEVNKKRMQLGSDLHI